MSVLIYSLLFVAPYLGGFTERIPVAAMVTGAGHKGSQCAVGMIEGGYLQIGLGAVGLGINARAASKGFGGCFDGGTLVHVPVDESTVHDAVWSDDDLLDSGSPRPAFRLADRVSRLGVSPGSNATASDWWRTGGTAPEFQASSTADWLDQLVETKPSTTTVPIEQIRLGQRVIGENPKPFDIDPDFADPVQSETRRIAATVPSSEVITTVYAT